MSRHAFRWTVGNRPLLDGFPIRCRSLTIDANPGHTEITLNLRVEVEQLEHDKARVRIDDETAAVLERLGWTPPEEETSGD